MRHRNSLGALLALFLSPFAAAAEKQLAVVDAKAVLRSGPPAFKAGTSRAAYGTVVTVLEEKDQHVRIAEPTDAAADCWLPKASLGSAKEFDPAMRPTDAIDTDKLTGLELTMAGLYNTRGKYLKEQAAKLGAKPADLAAVLYVESSGRGFGNDGRTIIRFENHIFDGKWGKKNKDAFATHFRYSTDKRWEGHEWRKGEADEWQKFHGNQDREWAVLEFAKTLDESAALQSASFGAAQIMGFNHKAVGYDSAADMVKAFDSGIKPQLDACIAFIEAHPACADGLKAGDYVKFARGYNGAGKEEAYAKSIRAAAEAYAKVAKGKASE